MLRDECAQPQAFIQLAYQKEAGVGSDPRPLGKKTSRYHEQARVENAFFRYKSIIGDGLRARTPDGRAVEALLACNMLNAMTDIGRPASYAVGR